MDGHRPRRSLTTSLLSAGSILLLLSAVLMGFFGPGCRDEVVLPIDRNLAPETVITGAPGDSQTTFYRVRIFWEGNDPDGEVVAYEWAVTESLPDPETIEYRRTTRTDSIFTFPVEENREVLGRRFYVRAIDNEGKLDPTPAFTFFASRNNCVPVVRFLRSEGIGPGQERRPITSTNNLVPTDTIPAGWSVRFAWQGRDCDVDLLPDGTIDSVGFVACYAHRLTPPEFSFPDCTPGDTAAVYPAGLLESNKYTFFVRAVDDAGFAGLDPATRTFVWNYDPVTRFSKEPVFPGSADSMEVFYADTAGLGEYFPFAEGDTLPLYIAGVNIRAYARGYDPDDPTGVGGVAQLQGRMVEDTGFWATLGPDRRFEASREVSAPFPGPAFTESSADGWKLMVRALDRLGRYDGTPDTLRFYVNKAPRWITEADLNGIPYRQRPREGQTIVLPAEQDTLQLRFAARDPDPASPEQVLEIQYRWDSFPLPGGGRDFETFFQPWTLQPSYWIALARLKNGVPFTPGEYVLTVRVRERRSLKEEFLGSRINERTVRFTIQVG